MAGIFAANPLSLSVPDSALDAWMRENDYHGVLDAAADEPRRAPVSSDSTLSSSNAEAAPSSLLLRGALGRVGGSAFVGAVRTLLAILTTNPFAKLAAEDFAGSTPPWTAGFLTAGDGRSGGEVSSYSWPAGPAQARMRVHENVKRYARSYACLWLLLFACTLYKMPLALLGVVSSLAIWEALRLGSSWWDLEESYPGLRFVLVRVAQIGALLPLFVALFDAAFRNAMAVILYTCNFQVAVLCAISISYTVMILHASLRKLVSPKQPAGTNRFKRSH